MASLAMPASNPFASRHLRPGAVAYLFAEGDSAAQAVERLQRQQWWGQVIGPHGTGKSTLLVALVPELELRGRHPLAVTLHQGQRRLPPLDSAPWTPGTQLVVDGYEQLSWWSKRQLQARCRAAGCGLLVTAHRDVGLPTILTTSTSLALTRQVVSRLLGGDDPRITQDDVAQAHAAAGGNVREALFRLFDIYQQRAGTSE